MCCFVSVAVFLTIMGSSSADNQHINRFENISKLLDSLVEEHDKFFRPSFGGPPVEIKTNVLIRSMGPISEEEMMFTMDCYFRQEWKDPRLAFEPLGELKIIRPSIRMFDKIWKPDTFFMNGQDSYLHTITYSNKLFRIYSSGDILYSQRLTIKASCPMNLQKYPLDSQVCQLFIGSYGYPQSDVVYNWKKMDTPVDIYKGISMAQFRLTGYNYGNKTQRAHHSLGPAGRQVLFINFELQREIGYYLLQIYLPCYLIVVISWVSFFINREATPARVMLGITTLLTTSTIAITGREGIPKVTYSTALDIYLLMCFCFVFAALVEYAGVNYFTKSITKDFTDESDEYNDPPENAQTTEPEPDPRRPLIRTQIYTAMRSNGHAIQKSPEVESCWSMFVNCLKGSSKYKTMRSRHRVGAVSVSKIDSLSRIIFPFVFTCLNVFYWAGFIYYF